MREILSTRPSRAEILFANQTLPHPAALRRGGTTFTYDPQGNRTGTTPPGGSATSYSYDQANRLSALGSTATYKYDGDGLRASKTVSGVTTPFVWDTVEGLPLLLSDGTNSYVYGPGGMPLEQIPIQKIALTATGSNQDAGPGTSITVNFSAAAAKNDQILVAVDENAGQNAQTPSTYTLVGTFNAPSGGEETRLFRKTAAGGESSVAVTFSQGSNLHAKAVAVAVYHNVDPTNPIDVQSSGGTGSGTSVTAPSVTTTGAGEQLVMVESGLNNALTATWTPPSGMTTAASSNSLPLVSLSVAGKALGAAGATGSQTATLSQSGSLEGVLLALKQQPPPVLYFHQDELGSTRLLTDGSGNVAATYSYDAYGNIPPGWKTGSASTPLQFAGQYTDAESGFQYLRARLYDPATGQFITRDPAVRSTQQPYLYVQGNPLNLTDPLGLFCFSLSCIAHDVLTVVQVGSLVVAVGAAILGQPEISAAALQLGRYAGYANAGLNCLQGNLKGCAVGAAITTGSDFVGSYVTGGASVASSTGVGVIRGGVGLFGDGLDWAMGYNPASGVAGNTYDSGAPCGYAPNRMPQFEQGVIPSYGPMRRASALQP